MRLRHRQGSGCVRGKNLREHPALDTALSSDLTDAPAPAKEEHLEPLKKSITKEIITPMVEQAKQEYGRDLKLSDQKRFESAAKAKMDVAVNKVVDNYRIDQSRLETQRTQQLKAAPLPSSASR